MVLSLSQFLPDIFQFGVLERKLNTYDGSCTLCVSLNDSGGVYMLRYALDDDCAIIERFLLRIALGFDFEEAVVDPGLFKARFHHLSLSFRAESDFDVSCLALVVAGGDRVDELDAFHLQVFVSVFYEELLDSELRLKLGNLATRQIGDQDLLRLKLGVMITEESLCFSHFFYWVLASLQLALVKRNVYGQTRVGDFIVWYPNGRLLVTVRG